MSVKIRLRRAGKRNAPCHRVVVTDQRSPRDGRFIEQVGTYDPRHDQETLNLERVDYWLSCGAQPSKTVHSLIKRIRAGQGTATNQPAAVSVAATPAEPEQPEAAAEQQ